MDKEELNLLYSEMQKCTQKLNELTNKLTQQAQGKNKQIDKTLLDEMDVARRQWQKATSNFMKAAKGYHNTN